jgi:hypothetical protein
MFKCYCWWFRIYFSNEKSIWFGNGIFIWRWEKYSTKFDTNLFEIPSDSMINSSSIDIQSLILDDDLAIQCLFQLYQNELQVINLSWNMDLSIWQQY